MWRLARASVVGVVCTVLVAWGIRLDAARHPSTQWWGLRAINQGEPLGLPVGPGFWTPNLEDSDCPIYSTPEGVLWKMRGVVNKPGILVIGVGLETGRWGKRSTHRRVGIGVESMPAWSKVDSFNEELYEPYFAGFYEYAVGWPYVAMYDRQYRDGMKAVILSNKDTLSLPPFYFEKQESVAVAVPIQDYLMQAMGPETLRLPVLPIWRGFVLNVIFYAALWLGGSYTVRRVLDRRRVRKCLRQGVCITRGCGYGLEGLSVCPECGVGQGVAT